jgi:hypothetical protein
VRPERTLRMAWEAKSCLDQWRQPALCSLVPGPRFTAHPTVAVAPNGSWRAFLAG